MTIILLKSTSLNLGCRESVSTTWKRRYRFPWNLIRHRRLSQHLFHLSPESVTTISARARARDLSRPHKSRRKYCAAVSSRGGDLSIVHGSRLRNLLSYVTHEMRARAPRVRVRLSDAISRRGGAAPCGFVYADDLEFQGAVVQEMRSGRRHESRRCHR